MGASKPLALIFRRASEFLVSYQDHLLGHRRVLLTNGWDKDERTRVLSPAWRGSG